MRTIKWKNVKDDELTTGFRIMNRITEEGTSFIKGGYMYNHTPEQYSSMFKKARSGKCISNSHTIYVIKRKNIWYKIIE